MSAQPSRAVAGVVHRLGSEELAAARDWWAGKGGDLRPGRRVNLFAGLSNGSPVEWAISETADADGLPAAEAALSEVSEARQQSSPEVQLAVSFTATLLSEEPPGSDALATAPYMLAVPFAAPPELLDELDAWYVEEHTGLLLRTGAWRQVRRYRINTITGAGWSRLALHALAQPNVFELPEIKEATSTPARQRLAEHPWFLAEGRPVLEAVAEVGRS